MAPTHHRGSLTYATTMTMAALQLVLAVAMMSQCSAQGTVKGFNSIILLAPGTRECEILAQSQTQWLLAMIITLAKRNLINISTVCRNSKCGEIPSADSSLHVFCFSGSTSSSSTSTPTCKHNSTSMGFRTSVSALFHHKNYAQISFHPLQAYVQFVVS